MADHHHLDDSAAAPRSNLPRRSLFNSTPSFVPTPSTPTPAPALLTLDSSRLGPGESSPTLDPTSSLEDPVRATINRRRIPRVEKDNDDPSSPVSTGRYAANRQQSTTLTTLSRLFAVQSVASPPEHRPLSDYHHSNGLPITCMFLSSASCNLCLHVSLVLTTSTSRRCS
jgi:hypothetical protein